jgi:GNAT superfamily N-acetyltransferase
VSVLGFREGRPADLRETFALGERAWQSSRRESGLLPPDWEPADGETEAVWQRERPLLEFIAGQPDGMFVVCEDGEQLVGYARVARFGGMDELTELWVAPSHAGRGVGSALLERCWPEPPAGLERVVLTQGKPRDLSLFTGFGLMPVAGHWHMRQRVDAYLERRSQELESTEPAVHALTPERAVTEWRRLEPDAVGHERPGLHEFFSRTRSCLASLHPSRGEATALCWVSSDSEIGPAVAESPEYLVAVVLAALDRVAKAQEPEELGVFVTTGSWALLARLRGLGFRLYWPSWVMCSVPMPSLVRYLPTMPPRLL